MFSRNLCPGGNNETGTKFVTAKQAIYHDAKHPSHIFATDDSVYLSFSTWSIARHSMLRLEALRSSPSCSLTALTSETSLPLSQVRAKWGKSVAPCHGA